MKSEKDKYKIHQSEKNPERLSLCQIRTSGIW